MKAQEICIVIVLLLGDGFDFIVPFNVYPDKAPCFVCRGDLSFEYANIAREDVAAS